jgi:hypothetical protein
MYYVADCSSQRNLLLRIPRMSVYVYITFSPVISNLEYTSLVWSYITSTDDSKQERIQQKYGALCFNPVFSHALNIYAYYLEQLIMHNLHKRDIALMHSSSLKLALVLNSVLSRSVYQRVLYVQCLLSQ